jgi:hypothetical protein
MLRDILLVAERNVRRFQWFKNARKCFLPGGLVRVQREA